MRLYDIELSNHRVTRIFHRRIVWSRKRITLRPPGSSMVSIGLAAER